MSLDLPSLEVLNISENELQQVDVSKCLNLTSVLAKTNQLQTVDFSQNSKLSTLVLSDNQLEQIDLSNNSELEFLWISANKLEQLDISKLPKLHNLSTINNPNLGCIAIAQDQSVATLNKTENQQLMVGGC